MFDSSPLPPRVEDSLPEKKTNSPAAAAPDNELHDWLNKIASKKAEISATAAAAAAASKELAALEAAAGLPQTNITSLLTSLTPETPVEHKQTTSEQVTARPPAQPTKTPPTRPTIPPAAQEPVLTDTDQTSPHKAPTDPAAADQLQAPSPSNDTSKECARTTVRQQTMPALWDSCGPQGPNTARPTRFSRRLYHDIRLKIPSSAT